ncbi:mechanosensitive ion channel family protein [Neolewinella agarilytica]|uniref:mechanosensitive ion channel family protein n=1 Tax=Neolewinella agarilytica TaxID=478744 RepID=UPI002357CB78|nr:mechanosensitive ion channel domain-containing protein [Neolewinella agarilytica]
MQFLESVKEWMVLNPTLASALKYVTWLILIILTISFLRKLLKRKLPDTSVRYKSQKAIEIVGYVLIIILTVSYFTGSVKDFTLAIGLLTAGITITLQELILSIAGSFYIFIVKVYQPGDRIEINGIKGDVIDIDSIYTTMMEIGEWVSSDNYSGRIVKLSNAFVFKGPIYNYSQDFPFVWDEINFPIRYGSDLDLAKSIVISTTAEILSEYLTQSRLNWKKVVSKYYIEDAKVEPTLAITMTDNWMQFNVRYIVDYRQRRSTKNLLNERIGKAILATDNKVTLASATIEIIKIPDLNLTAQGSTVEDS